MDKKFTKRQFGALTNEAIRLCKEITTLDNFSSSIHFEKGYFYISVHNDNEHKSFGHVFFFRLERYLPIKQFGEVTYIINKHNLHLGKYLTLIMDAYNNADKTEYYFSF